METNKPNFTPFIAHELNTRAGESHTVVATFQKTTGDVLSTYVLTQTNDAPVQFYRFTRETDDDGEVSELCATVYKPNPAKYAKVKDLAGKFDVLPQDILRWLDKGMEDKSIDASMLMYDPEDATRIVGVSYAGVIALFKSRVTAAPRGRSAADNVLILDFGKGKKASAIKAHIAALLAANDYDAAVYTRKDWSAILKDKRANKAKATQAQPA